MHVGSWWHKLRLEAFHGIDNWIWEASCVLFCIQDQVGIGSSFLSISIFYSFSHNQPFLLSTSIHHNQTSVPPSHISLFSLSLSLSLSLSVLPLHYNILFISSGGTLFSTTIHHYHHHLLLLLQTMNSIWQSLASSDGVSISFWITELVGSLNAKIKKKRFDL